MLGIKELDLQTHFNNYFVRKHVYLALQLNTWIKKAEIWHVLSKNKGERYSTNVGINGCVFAIAIPIGCYFG